MVLAGAVVIVLTGGTGFLGSHLLRALLADGEDVLLLKRSTSSLARIAGLEHEVRTLDLDLKDPEEVFASGQVKQVLHCATDYGRRNIDPYRVIEANIILPLRLLHLASRYGVHRFINTDTILDKRISHYSLSKSQFAQWLEAYSRSLECVNVALEHFYGPHDDDSKFVPYVLRVLLRGDPELALTLGEQLRYFLYIDDVVEAFRFILRADSSGETGLRNYEVGAEAPVSIRQFVELARTLTANSTTVLRFGALPYRQNEIMDPDIDVSALEGLGWQPRVSLADGLAATIAEEKRSLVK